MCGIFAYSGSQDARQKLVDGLRKLEYRGYDSAGITTLSNNKDIFTQKSVGRVSSLASKVDAAMKSQNDSPSYTTGIGHTRWATHGGVNEANTHPHHSSDDRFFIVHNGIIENYKELKDKLSSKYDFYSDTDTEVIVKLIEELYNGDLKATMEQVVKRLVGAYSVAVIDRENPGEIVGIKLGSPLVVATGNDGIYISSDVNALGSLADSYNILEDHEMVVIRDGSYQIYMAGETVARDEQDIQSEQVVDDIGNFSSYTEKEIFDIPTVIENVFSGRLNFAQKDIRNETLDDLTSQGFSSICVISPGSSYYAGDIGCYFFRRFADMPAQSIISSEFLSDRFVPDHNTLYIFLSQSGETADTRESMKIVQAKGCTTFAIVNVVGSTIARMADYGLYSHAGIEVGVASTKNVIAQIALLLMVALSFGKSRNMQIGDMRSIIAELEHLPDKINTVLLDAPKIKKLSQKYKDYDDMFVLGRNYFYPAAGETALKCKELSYIHAEAYSAGELKHGPLALVSPDFPIMVFNPAGEFYPKTISNIQEVVAREGPVLGYISKNDPHSELYTDAIVLPESTELLSLFTGLTASYLFALYLAEALGRDVDKPRNLAKSVTVE